MLTQNTVVNGSDLSRVFWCDGHIIVVHRNTHLEVCALFCPRRYAHYGNIHWRRYEKGRKDRVHYYCILAWYFHWLYVFRWGSVVQYSIPSFRHTAGTMFPQFFMLLVLCILSSSDNWWSVRSVHHTACVLSSQSIILLILCSISPSYSRCSIPSAHHTAGVVFSESIILPVLYPQFKRLLGGSIPSVLYTGGVVFSQSTILLM